MARLAGHFTPGLRYAMVHGRDPLHCERMRDFLSRLPDLVVSGAATTIGGVLGQLETLKADLVVSQVGAPPDHRSFALAQELRTRYPDIDVVVVGSHGPRTPDDYMEAGATDVLLGDVSVEDLESAVGEDVPSPKRQPHLN